MSARRKSLKKRVAAYTPRSAAAGPPAAHGGRRPARWSSITTHTEAEALLLEINLIKQLKPRYNVLLRDDKSFPYILITGDHASPQIVKHRGARTRKGDYFGPFASAGAVNSTLNALQRAFLLRSCSRQRLREPHAARACSTRSSAAARPASAASSRTTTQTLVDEARDFLTGKSQRCSGAAAPKHARRQRERSSSSAPRAYATASGR